VRTALEGKIMRPRPHAGILNYMLRSWRVRQWFGSTAGAVASILIIERGTGAVAWALILLDGAEGSATEPS